MNGVMLRAEAATTKRAWLLLSLLGAASLGACKMDLDYLSEGAAGSAVEGGSGGSSPSTDGGSGGAFVSMGGTFGAGGVPSGGGTESGGSAGKPEEGGSTGDAGAPAAVTKYDIVSQDGVVVADSNTFGIDGEWREFGYDVSAIETRFIGSQVCIRGEIVAGGWGGGLQLVLRQPAVAGDRGPPYDAVANGMAGIRLVIEGSKVPTRARVKFKQIGTNDDYCREIAPKSGDLITLRTEDALHSCPVPGGGAVNPTQLENFEIHLFPEASASLPFDFCVKQVTVIAAD